ncbi:uncharacterized protein G2W53_005578 [Senna tora]|uniref:Uncharacterized protein n=1 Tax=Senna tora TaxID=362788 RepID=A0A834X2N1_9FABA|nr:uncharacterized protein G2W53_005578 [Senna tora]
MEVGPRGILARVRPPSNFPNVRPN